MQNAFVDEPRVSDSSQQKSPALEMTDLEAEIEAALLGQQSPTLLKAQESFELFSVSEQESDDLGGFLF